MQRIWITVPKIAKEIRFDMPLSEEFLIATKTRLARGKELLVNLGLIDAGHRSAVQSQRARSHDQLCTLQAGISLGGCLG